MNKENTLPILGHFKTYKNFIEIKGHNDRFIDPLQIKSLNDNCIYLTFDTCPTSEVNFDVIKWLHENEIEHTIFLNSNWYKLNSSKDLSFLKSPLCTIGGHGFNHKRAFHMTYDEQYEDVLKCKDFIKDELGIDIKWYRSPWGRPNEDTHKILSTLDLRFASWSGFIFDKQSDESKIDLQKSSIDYIKNNIKGGEILIFHINGQGKNTLGLLKETYNILKSKYDFKKL